mmetsp:Transcript_38578/g.90629  ORF Transcript_38578/g.90629 Transcript_38578/m.90629 type:complete len:211 (-) Transcript_38578:129-761(-)
MLIKGSRVILRAELPWCWTTWHIVLVTICQGIQGSGHTNGHFAEADQHAIRVDSHFAAGIRRWATSGDAVECHSDVLRLTPPSPHLAASQACVKDDLIISLVRSSVPSCKRRFNAFMPATRGAIDPNIIAAKKILHKEYVRPIGKVAADNLCILNHCIWVDPYGHGPIIRNVPHAQGDIIVLAISLNSTSYTRDWRQIRNYPHSQDLRSP